MVGRVTNIGLIGYGYWGTNLARNIASHPRSRLHALCEFDSQKSALCLQRYPTVAGYAEFSALLRNDDIEAVVLCVPVALHYELASLALKAGKHVLVEKPMVTDPREAELLCEEADKRNLTLMVDHTFVYSGAVQEIKSVINSGKLGQVLYYDSTRINLGLIRSDVNVLWDLAVHDVAIMDYLLDDPVRAVSAHGKAYFGQKKENMAYLTLQLESGAIGHIHVNWLAPVKVRTTLLGGTEQMLVYNDVEPDEKVKIYNKGVTLVADSTEELAHRIEYRTGGIYIPKLDRQEPLAKLIDHFVSAVQIGQKPKTDGAAGLRVTRILAAAHSSLRENGKWIVV